MSGTAPLLLTLLMQLLFDAMENTPCSLALSYSLQAVGMDYERAMFGMKLADCRWVVCQVIEGGTLERHSIAGLRYLLDKPCGPAG